jgi:hypothetical protein
MGWFQQEDSKGSREAVQVMPCINTAPIAMGLLHQGILLYRVQECRV